MKRIAALAFWAALIVDPAIAQGDAPNKWVWHTVRAGETLQSITTDYMGSPSFWRDNWKLNPDIGDPDVLAPGQRIKVLAGTAAEVTVVSRRVDERVQPRPWQPANIGTRLRQRDGLRTHEQSSAELRFRDGARLQVTEDTMLFIRDTGDSPEEVQRRVVEIRTGQADVEQPPAVADASNPIEVILGEAAVKALPARDATGRTRARRESERALLMVYSGSSQITAAGRTVAVPNGMGTVAADGAAPSAPERLLPAPRLVAPPNGDLLSHSNPVLQWELIPEAASYTVEICRDSACSALVARGEGITDAHWQPDRLPIGDLYWRVAAVSRSGLDGFTGTPWRFYVESLWRRPDRRPR